jgi:phosphate starvation-inducible PhoH-like protein
MKTISLDSVALDALAGPLDESLRLIEERFDVRVSARNGSVTIQGEGEGSGRREDRVADLLFHFVDMRLKPSARKTVVAKSPNQRLYIDAMSNNDLVFGVGPAGTGKTYLAVAMAISLLNEKRIQRILLCRPAVEAGERLGFLPGDIAAKVDPYLRPLYDALHDMLEPERIEQLVERGTIEVAPLAFMRGRTLNDAFIILDEAQNTTPEQMKMFLTRIGLDSRAAVTGDVTQIDLPAQRTSGLVEAQEVVSGIPGIAVVHFDKTDVVRHPLVQRIVVAYDERALRRKEARANGNSGGDERP